MLKYKIYTFKTGLTCTDILCTGFSLFVKFSSIQTPGHQTQRLLSTT